MFRRPTDASEADFPIPHRALGDFAEVEPLLALCSAGMLYEVESWIDQGKPLQYPPSKDRKIQRRPTALQIAIRRGFHSLAALLLANGYDPNADYHEPLSPAVRAKDRDMVDLLLRFGANPNATDFGDVLETCDRWLMDRFIAAGVDPCRDNAIAKAVHFKARPILGFIKQYKDRFTCIQRQIDIALHVFTDAGDVKGVALMFWVGADPHARTPSSAYDTPGPDGECSTAFETALYSSKPEVLALFTKRPIPDDRVNELFRSVAYGCSPDLVRRLLGQGADPNGVSEEGYHVLHGFFYPILSRFDREPNQVELAFEALEVVLKAGASWNMDEHHLKGLRRDLADGESRIVLRLLELLKHYGAFSAEQLHELTRTPAVRRVLNGVTKPQRNFWGANYTPAPPPPVAPSPSPQPRSYWKRHWSRRE